MLLEPPPVERIQSRAQRTLQYRRRIDAKPSIGLEAISEFSSAAIHRLPLRQAADPSRTSLQARLITAHTSTHYRTQQPPDHHNSVHVPDVPVPKPTTQRDDRKTTSRWLSGED